MMLLADRHDVISHYGDTDANGIADKNSSKDIYFSGVGKYRVTFKESDLSYKLTALTTNQAPVAVVTPTTQTVKLGDSLVLDASASTDDNGIASYSWSTGGTASKETVLFDTLGTKAVTVTVTDADGLTSKATANITVVDGSVSYVSSWPTMYFRGTPNSWGKTAMTLVADHVQNLKRQAN